MISAGQIYDELEKTAPFSTAMSFDNVGLLIGNRDKQSEKVLLSLDLTRSVIMEAVQKDAGIVITHHPVIFNPLRTLDTDSIPYLAVQNGITVISAHTNLDIAAGGVNDTLAKAVGIISDNGTDEDCMLVGGLEKPMETYEFAEVIKKALGCRGLRYTCKNGLINTVAAACGAGGSCVFAAYKAGADAFVTGEIKHHEILFASEHNMAVFDIGHFRSEDMIIPELAALLNKNLKGAVFEQAESDTDPIYYL